MKNVLLLAGLLIAGSAHAQNPPPPNAFTTKLFDLVREPDATADQVKALIQAGADVNGVEPGLGTSVLTFAAMAAPNLGVVKALVDAGADIHAKAAGGEAVLAFAAQNTDDQIVEYFIAKGLDVNGAPDYVWSPIYEATNNPNSEVIRALIRAGAKVNSPQHSAGELLCRAANGNPRVDVVRAIYETGFDLTQAIHWGTDSVPALWCAARGSVDTINFLISEKADVNAKESQKGVTPLMIAAQGSEIDDTTDNLKAFLNAHADVNATDVDGKSALIYVVAQIPFGGYPAVTIPRGKKLDAQLVTKIKLLVAAGADLSQKTKDGKTAYDLAVANKVYDDVTQLLKTGK